MFTIQTLPTPRIGLCTDVDMYVRVHDGAFWSFDESAAVLDAGGCVTTDTYFGVVPVGTWKRHTTLDDIEVVAGVSGDAEVDLVHNRPGHGPRVVASGRSTGDADDVVLPARLDEVDDGHLYLRVRAHATGARFRSMRVRTTAQPARAVRLGISVTTFNREHYVRANVARLDDYLGTRDDLRAAVRLVIVDNASNLDLEDTQHLDKRTVGSRNLGGAGGFARGLMELRDGGWATHVLFMDDDVSFEPEIVGRILSLMAFATDPTLCISGSMLREEFPNRQFEAGARIDPNRVHIWQVNGSDLDLTDVDDLLANEADQHIDYGGWWCFAFPIDLTDDYPVPLFVRGDDVCFGLRYCAGRTIAVNGVGVWHQDFAHKNGPVAFFYEARNIPLVLSVSRDDYGPAALRKRVAERTLRFASAFKYDSAEAVLDGTAAFLDGPDHLLATSSDIVHDAVRARYGERPAALEPADRSVPAWRPPRAPLPVAWRVASLLTLGGHLLPRRLRRAGRWATRADGTPAMATIGAEAIVFRHDATGEGFVSTRDQDRFRAILRRLVATERRIGDEFPTVVDAWRAAYPKMVSDGYWRDQFDQHTGD